MLYLYEIIDKFKDLDIMERGKKERQKDSRGGDSGWDGWEEWFCRGFVEEEGGVVVTTGRCNLDRLEGG
jgi:hypothetical protein